MRLRTFRRSVHPEVSVRHEPDPECALCQRPRQKGKVWPCPFHTTIRNHDRESRPAAAGRRQRSQWAAKPGRCVMCNQPAVTARHCQKHRDHINAYHRARRRRAREG